MAPCAAPDCFGTSLAEGDACIVHADGPGRKRALADVADHRSLDLLRGVVVDHELLAEVLARLPVDPDGRRIVRHGTFEATRFEGAATFAGTVFHGTADFTGAAFADRASFGGASFGGDAAFADAYFEHGVDFDGASFGGGASFKGAVVRESASLARTEFRGDLRFEGVQAPFVDFHHAVFLDQVELRATVEMLVLDGCRFAEADRIGPVLASERADLSKAQFESHVHILVTTRDLACEWTVFRGGGVLRAAAEEIEFFGAQFLRPTIVTGDKGRRPRIATLQEADVSHLSLGHVDLSECRFIGAHGLDSLRIDADCVMAQSPPRTTRRRIIFEEHLWRTGGPHSTIALDASWHPAAGAVEEVYRLLRKGREDRHDAPGAADFYYGEMEMRRRAASSWSERRLLDLYWLVSGYGLRTLRAVVAFAVVVLAAALLFDRVGFRHDHPFSEALLDAFGSATGVPPSEDGLTAWGRLVRLSTRIVGPVFLALAALSVRGRLKRH